MRRILDIIRVQRHDFLNHLQVVSGLIQLNKPEKALEYINKISYQEAHSKYVCRLDNNPELALALMCSQHEAAKRGIELEIIVVEFTDCELSNQVLVKLIEKLIEFGINNCNDDDDFCQLSLLCNKNSSKIELECPAGQEVSSPLLSDLQKEVSNCGLEVDLQVKAGLCQLSLQIPKKQVCVAG